MLSADSSSIPINPLILGNFPSYLYRRDLQSYSYRTLSATCYAIYKPNQSVTPYTQCIKTLLLLVLLDISLLHILQRIFDHHYQHQNHICDLQYHLHQHNNHQHCYISTFNDSNITTITKNISLISTITTTSAIITTTTTTITP